MVNRPLIFKVLKTIFLSLLAVIIILFITVIVLYSTGNPGGRPPDYSVINPVVISDEAGGQIVAYQNNHSEGPITHVQRIGADGKSSGGWQYTQLDSSQPYKPYVASPTELIGDGKGNSIVVWGLGDDIWIKKFDINGNSVWKSKVKAGKCHELYKLKAISDNQGGVLIGCYGKKGDFWLQEVSSDGKPMWSPEKRLSNIVGFDIATDSSGDILLFYVTFERSIYLQKVDPSGINIWGSAILLDTHRPVLSNEIKPTDSWELSGYTPYPKTVYPYRAEFGEYAIWVISDETGGCIAGYSDVYADTYADRSLNVYKIDSEGNTLWTKILPPPSGDQSSQIVDFGMSRVVGDGFGGIFILCKVISRSKDMSIIVQRIDSSGNETLNTDDAPEVIDNAWNVDRYLGYQAISDGSGGVVVIWASSTRDENNVRTGAILRGQRLDKDGKKQWDESGVILSNTNVSGMNTSPSITTDGSGGFIVSLGGMGSMIWKVGPDGKLLWEKKI